MRAHPKRLSFAPACCGSANPPNGLRTTAGTTRHRCGRSAPIVDQSAKAISAHDPARCHRLIRDIAPRSLLAQSLVWRTFLVVLNEFAEHIFFKVATTEDQHVIEDLAPGCSHLRASLPERRPNPRAGQVCDEREPALPRCMCGSEHREATQVFSNRAEPTSRLVEPCRSAIRDHGMRSSSSRNAEALDSRACAALDGPLGEEAETSALSRPLCRS